MNRMPRISSLLSVALLLSLAGTASALGDVPDPVWFGADGKPLPFDSHEDAVEFLRAATVIDSEEIGGSQNHPLRVLLEKDGVRARAVFRSVRRTWQREWVRGTWQVHLIDRASSERGAYVVARMLGFDNIPPTVLRKIGGRQGSLQLWLEGVDSVAGLSESRGNVPERWTEQMSAIWAFDNLVFNVDRHPGNLLIGADGTVWMIDHTQAFQYNKRLLDIDNVMSIPQTMWERLQTIPDSAFEEALAGALNGTQVGALLARRKRMVERIQGLIAERGEQPVVRRPTR